MATSTRKPPRFVPTLTEVVQHDTLLPSPAPAFAPSPSPLLPPASAPALTPTFAAFPLGLPSAAVADSPARLSEDMEESLVHRIMQRVDAQLEQHLRDCIAAVVQEQTRSIVPRLREEVESVVRHAVYEAVAQELGLDV